MLLELLMGPLLFVDQVAWHVFTALPGGAPQVEVSLSLRLRLSCRDPDDPIGVSPGACMTRPQGQTEFRITVLPCHTWLHHLQITTGEHCRPGWRRTSFTQASLIQRPTRLQHAQRSCPGLTGRSIPRECLNRLSASAGLITRRRRTSCGLALASRNARAAKARKGRSQSDESRR